MMRLLSLHYYPDTAECLDPMGRATDTPDILLVPFDHGLFGLITESRPR